MTVSIVCQVRLRPFTLPRLVDRVAGVERAAARVDVAPGRRTREAHPPRAGLSRLDRGSREL
jgi:hypothetical protein